jgi:hypothetical protein
MKLNLTADGKIPDHFWKMMFVVVACVAGLNSDSILLLAGVDRDWET